MMPRHALEGLGAMAAAVVAAVSALSILYPTETRALERGTTIEVFTTSDLPAVGIPNLDGVDIQVWRLDGLVQAQETLSRDLPADQAQAARIAGERFLHLKPRIAPLMMEAAEGLAHALYEDGLDRYPAIVFHVPGHQPTVVYGMRDVSAAIRLQDARGGAN